MAEPEKPDTQIKSESSPMRRFRKKPDVKYSQRSSSVGYLSSISAEREVLDPSMRFKIRKGVESSSEQSVVMFRIRRSFLSLFQSSDYGEVFTPECVQRDDEDKHKSIYRFVCSHAEPDTQIKSESSPRRRFGMNPDVMRLQRAESSSGQSSSDYGEVFTPECVQRDDQEKHKTIYRFVCSHAGQFQCSLTSLVFVMEDEGEVLYNTVSWDSGLGQVQPAGPLYNIECSAEENKDCLAVAHVTGGNVEIIQPLRVTETHVIIDIRDLSIFGLIWIKKKFGFPIKGQVLLFLRPVTVKQKILNVHLLPGNVPVSEVQRWHLDKKYIETSSKCQLFPKKQYSLCCQPEDCEVQPVSEMFELDPFGPNYHPTFEVFLDVNIEEVRLGVLDKLRDGKEVWKTRRILLTVAPSKGVEPPVQRRIPETEFVKTNRDKLIQRVSSVMAIADSLMSQDMINSEMYSKVRAADTREEKMRHLLDALDSGGAAVKAEFCRLLKEKEPYLANDLGLHL